MEDSFQKDIVTIDFKAFLKVLWKEKWVIVAVLCGSIFIGLWYALNAREEFVSKGKILPEVTSSGGSFGGLAGLAALGGINLGSSGTEAIRPDLYPDIINSTPFFLNLFDQKFLNKNGDSLIFESFYHKVIEEEKIVEEKMTSTFLGKPKGVIVLNKLTQNRIKDMRTRVVGGIDKKSGSISISTKLPDPVLAAEVTKYAMSYLTDYVTNYRTEKIKQEVDFLGRKLAAAKGEFYKDQSRKAFYADQFSAPTIRLQSADMDRERIESEYRMSSNVYTELLTKYEEAKIKLQQETPIFQVLEPPIATTVKSEPRRILILFGSFVIGFFIAIPLVLFLRGNYKLIFK